MNATKLVYIYLPCFAYSTQHKEAKQNFVNWYLYVVDNGKISPTTFLLGSKTWFQLSG
jgi:hypothetical protein